MRTPCCAVLCCTARPPQGAKAAASALMVSPDCPALDKVWLAGLLPSAAPGNLADSGLGSWPAAGSAATSYDLTAATTGAVRPFSSSSPYQQQQHKVVDLTNLTCNYDSDDWLEGCWEQSLDDQLIRSSPEPSSSPVTLLGSSDLDNSGSATPTAALSRGKVEIVRPTSYHAPGHVDAASALSSHYQQPHASRWPWLRPDIVSSTMQPGRQQQRISGSQANTWSSHAAVHNWTATAMQQQLAALVSLAPRDAEAGAGAATNRIRQDALLRPAGAISTTTATTSTNSCNRTHSKAGCSVRASKSSTAPLAVPTTMQHDKTLVWPDSWPARVQQVHHVHQRSSTSSKQRQNMAAAAPSVGDKHSLSVRMQEHALKSFAGHYSSRRQRQQSPPVYRSKGGKVRAELLGRHSGSSSAATGGAAGALQRAAQQAVAEMAAAQQHLARQRMVQPASDAHEAATAAGAAHAVQTSMPQLHRHEYRQQQQQEQQAAASRRGVVLLSDAELFDRADNAAMGRAGAFGRRALRRRGMQQGALQVVAQPTLTMDDVRLELLRWGFLGAVGGNAAAPGAAAAHAARHAELSKLLEGGSRVPLHFSSAAAYARLFGLLLLDEMRASMAAAREEMLTDSSAGACSLPLRVGAVSRESSVHIIEVYVDVAFGNISGHRGSGSAGGMRQQRGPQRNDWVLLTKAALPGAAALADCALPHAHLAALVCEEQLAGDSDGGGRLLALTLHVVLASTGSDVMAAHWQSLLVTGASLWVTAITSLTPNFREFQVWLWM